MGLDFETMFYYDINDEGIYMGSYLKAVMNSTDGFIDSSYLIKNHNINKFCEHSRVIVTSWSSYDGPKTITLKTLKIRQT